MSDLIKLLLSWLSGDKAETAKDLQSEYDIENIGDVYIPFMIDDLLN